MARHVPQLFLEQLAREAFPDPIEKGRYAQLLYELNDIPFYWFLESDQNRAGDAISYRQYDFPALTGYQLTTREDFDWFEGAPSVLEVLLAISRRWMFTYDGSIDHYFHHLMSNLGLLHYRGRIYPQDREDIRMIIDRWLLREFDPDGRGSPFPIIQFAPADQRQVPIWEQMHAYSMEHFR